MAEELEQTTPGPVQPQDSAQDEASQGAGQLGQDSNLGGEEGFFDPANLSPELHTVYRKMQQAYTRKTQAIARERDKIAAYDDFMRDPHGSIHRIAGQYGIQIGPTNAEKPKQAIPQNWAPTSWDDVITKSEERVAPIIKDQIMSQIQPILREFQSMKQREIESTLNEVSPDWRLYEDEMVSLLNQHPSLVNDPKLLARLSIPEEVSKKRASESAMKKVQRKVESAMSATGSTTSRAPEPDTNKPMSFNDAVALAKQQLSKKGINY